MQCKKCGNTDFEFLEGKRKKVSAVIKIILLIFIVFMIGNSGNSENKAGVYIGAILLIALLGYMIYDHLRCKGTHTKAVCKKCGKYKWIN